MHCKRNGITRAFFLTFGFALAICQLPKADAAFIAYQNPAGVGGNQLIHGESLGLDFNVISPIEVTQLGVFDDNSTGVASPMVLAIFDRTTQLSVVTETLTGSSGTQIGGSLFGTLATPFYLPAGFQGSIIAYYSESNLVHDGNPLAGVSTDSGGGLISFVGQGRYSNTGIPEANIVYPTILAGGDANPFATGTFTFTSVPEPSSLVLGAISSIGLLMRRRRVRTS
jgi:hypothetical protein